MEQNKLFKEKDIEILNDFKYQEELYNVINDDNVVVEMHVYDLADNRIYSKHKIKRNTYEVERIYENETTVTESLQEENKEESLI